MTTPFETSAAVLDAAAAGTTVPGYEQIGGLLIDLARTTAVAPGTALGSGGVAAACAATAPGRLTAGVGLVKPGFIVACLVSLAVVIGAVLTSSSSSTPAVVVTPGEPDAGVSRVVPVAGPSTAALDAEDAPPPDSSPARAPDGSATVPLRPGPSNGSGGTGDEATNTEPTNSSTTQPTTVSTTNVPSTTVPSTTVPSTTVPSTTVPSTTVPEPLGNNGNDNGNGVGNGKGNQGSGTPGGGGSGDRGPGVGE